MVFGLDSTPILDVEILYPLLHAPPFHSQKKNKNVEEFKIKKIRYTFCKCFFFFFFPCIGSELNLWHSNFGKRCTFANSYISEATYPFSLAFSPELVFSFPCSCRGVCLQKSTLQHREMLIQCDLGDKMIS